MKLKIESLTDEQKAKFPLYVERWTKIGLSTEPADRAIAEAALRKCYDLSGLAQPKQIIWTTSPLAGCVLIGILKDEKLMENILAGLAKHIDPGASVGDSVRDSVRASVRDSVGASVRDGVWAGVWDSVGAGVWASVRDSVRDSVGVSVRDSVWAGVWAGVGDSVWDSVRDSVWASVGDSVRDSVGVSVRDSVWAGVGASVRDSVWAGVGDSVWAGVWDSVRDSVWDSVWAGVWDSVGDSVWDSVWASVGDSVWAGVWDSVRSVWNENYYSYYLGQFDSGAMAHFEFFKEICGLIKETENAIPLWDLAKHSSWIYPYQNTAVVSEKPVVISVNNAGKIHCETGPCVAYSDGFSVYGLNGVRVTKEIVETPAKELSCQLVLTEKNAEIRREIVKKIGVARICVDLKAVAIDAAYGYELLGLNLGDGRIRPYLKMTNPSIGELHIEGVHPDCKTVESALAWRNQTDKYIKPEVLT